MVSLIIISALARINRGLRVPKCIAARAGSGLGPIGGRCGHLERLPPREPWGFPMEPCLLSRPRSGIGGCLFSTHSAPGRCWARCFSLHGDRRYQVGFSGKIGLVVAASHRLPQSPKRPSSVLEPLGTKQNCYKRVLR